MDEKYPQNTNLFYGNSDNYYQRSKMKAPSVIITYVSLCITILSVAYCYQDVGGEFGMSWLQQHGVQFSSTSAAQNNLWNWGSAPKGFALFDGKIIPPGYGTQWYYPGTQANSTPIIINSTATAGSNLLVPNFQSSISEDAWLESQLIGRPVAIANTPKGPLF